MRRSEVPLALLLVAGLAAPGSGNGWTPLAHQPPVSAGASLMLLLTDGRVLMSDGAQANSTTHWWFLTPDSNGSYVNGTWRAAPDANFDRLWFASAVLADGRVIVAGGEASNLGGGMTTATEIFDPVAKTWTNVAPPNGWTEIGDAPACLLADGRWLLGSPHTNETAIYDPIAAAWSAGPAKLDRQSVEESWALMPDGSVVTCSVLDEPHSERYVPSLDAWIDCGDTPVDLIHCREVGAEVLMNDGRMFCMGGTPHCALYTSPDVSSAPGTWTQGGDPPTVGRLVLGQQDGPCCLLPSGHVLCALAYVSDNCYAHHPTYFCEFDGANFFRVPDSPNNVGYPFEGNMLLLPTGEVLFAARKLIYAYTSDGAPDPAWKPTISSVPGELVPGLDYQLSGTQLNGLSQAVGYGDDAQASTNYPLVRLTNLNTHHVRYCRTHDHSTMGVATGSAEVATNFRVPLDAEPGPALLEVVVNSIASDAVPVFVETRILLDFDALATGVQVANQYPEATFSSDPGFADWTVATSLGNSLPNALSTGPVGGGSDGTHGVFVDFTRPVIGLTFDAVGVDDAGLVATVNVYERGVFTAAVPVTGAGDPLAPVPVDLTIYRDVTRIEIVGVVDTGGIAWDDFAFAVPAAHWFNYGAGYGGTLGVPVLTAEQDPVVGTAITLDVGNSLGSSTAALFLAGVKSQSTPTAKGGVLLVEPLLVVPMVVAAAGSTLSGFLPNDPYLAGTTLFAQAIEVDAGAAFGLSFTRGLELDLGF